MSTSARAPSGIISAVNAVTATPNRTLYIRNLPDKLAKQDLQRNLYMLFVTYGLLLDIVALKTTKMRGQAHVVFRDTDASTQAMRALQGFNFFGHDMQIFFAKTKSDVVTKLEGVYKIPATEIETITNGELHCVQNNNLSVNEMQTGAANAQELGVGHKRPRDSNSEDDNDLDIDMDVSDGETD